MHSSYRPQTKFAKVMFLNVSHSVHRGGGLPQCMLGYHSPPDQAPPLTRHPLGPDPPLDQAPPSPGTPSDQTPSGPGTPQSRHTPVRSACWEIRSTSGRYASYWNAFLLTIFLTTLPSTLILMVPFPVLIPVPAC